MLRIRRLDEPDFERLYEIDVSEHITLVYRVRDGQLVPENHNWHRPRWDAAAWAREIEHWRTDLKPDVWLGAFADEALAGMASLRHRLADAMAQLTTLHVGREHRRRGLARALLREVMALARDGGATSLYVSATPSESAVGFYLSEEFRLTAEPDPGMFALEPEDIHMVRNLDSQRP